MHFISVQEYLSKRVTENAVSIPKLKKPLSLPTCGKLIDNPNALPTFTIENVLDYLINRKEDDCMRAEDWKSFKAGGYRLFKDGHVQNIMVDQKDSLLGIRCNCLPEMKKDRVYKIQIDISSDSSDVNFAECTCPAGKGPHGSCKHVAAVLFALQDFYVTYEEMQTSNKDDVACTSKLQTWNQPRKRRLDSKCASEISFRVEDYYQKPCRHSKEFMDPRPINMQKTTEKEVKGFIENLKGMEYACGFLSVLVPLDTPDDPSSPLPLTPRSAQSKINAQIVKECELPPSLEVITSYFDKFVGMIKPSDDQRNLVEKKTRKQGSCKRWQEECHLRLTASNFGRVMLQRSNYEKLAEEILYSKLPDTIASLKWGKTHENDAFTTYLERYLTSDEQETIRKAGFYIGNPCFIGASPDGVIEVEGNVRKVIEIKCPFSFRNCSVEEACTKKEFYCTMEDNLLHLKKTHLYYYQIQGTMAITGATECDFIVWTPVSMEVENVAFDKALWEDVMLPKLHEFYYKYMLPFVVY